MTALDEHKADARRHAFEAYSSTMTEASRERENAIVEAIRSFDNEREAGGGHWWAEGAAYRLFHAAKVAEDIFSATREGAWAIHEEALWPITLCDVVGSRA